jgi:hypothetical protein
MRTVMTSHTIADVFHFYSNTLSRKKPVSVIGPKKGGVCYGGAYATKKLVTRLFLVLQSMYP